MIETAMETTPPLLHVSTPPHIRQSESVPTIMLSVIIALVPALAASMVFFGGRALALAVVCAAAAAGAEALLCFLLRKPHSVFDFSAVVSGLLLACMLPPGLPFWMAVVGSVFAMAVVKMAFGGLGRNPVNPALAARAFLMVSFPSAMSAFTAPAHGTLFGLARGLDGVTAATPLVYFKNAMASGNFHPLDLQDAIGSLVLGNVGGCLGATSGLAILAGAVFLLYRGIIRFRIPLAFIGSVFLLYWIFNGTGDIFSTEAFIVPLYQVFGGGIILGAFFLANDPVSTPMTPYGRLFFGVGCGVLTFLIRKFGGYPDGVCWAILLMNFCVPILDWYGRPRRFGERKAVIFSLPLILLGSLGLLFGAAIAIASRAFRVNADANVKKIDLALPGVDCGACGYSTCKKFANAVAEGKANPTGCIPGGSKTAHEIGDVLGIPVTPLEPVMAVVHCKGGNKEASQRCVYEGIQDCHAAILAGNGQKTCADGCLGLGSCVAACPFDAIRVADNGIAVVNQEACAGCGLCARACPRSIIDLIPRVHKIYLSCANHDRGARVKKYCSVGCTACTLCAKATPSGAITMENNLPALNYASGDNFVVAAYTCPSDCFVDLVKFRPKVNIDTKCTGCGDCLPLCPTDAIAGEKGLRHVVNKKKCIGCGLCLNTCSVHAIAMWGALGYAEDNTRRIVSG